LLYNERGSRYGILTTNLAEVYNWVLPSVRDLPLVGIVEFFLYRTCKYWDQCTVAEQAMVDNQKIYGYKMTEYMEEAFKKALKHHVQPVGAVEH
jgi:hypothetical protein